MVPKNPMQLNTFNIIFLNLGGKYSEDLPEGLRFATALLTTNMTDDERREVLRKKYKIPMREYPKEGLMNVSCIYEDTKRRFLREGREEGLKEGITKNRIDSIKAIVSNLNCSIDQAMDTLNIPESERDNLKSIIDSQTLS